MKRSLLVVTILWVGSTSIFRARKQNSKLEPGGTRSTSRVFEAVAQDKTRLAFICDCASVKTVTSSGLVWPQCARFEKLKGHRPSRLRFFVLVLVPGTWYRDGAVRIPLQNLDSPSLISYHVTGHHTIFRNCWSRLNIRLSSRLISAIIVQPG